jgi:hypothetical protein
MRCLSSCSWNFNISQSTESRISLKPDGRSQTSRIFVGRKILEAESDRQLSWMERKAISVMSAKPFADIRKI